MNLFEQQQPPAKAETEGPKEPQNDQAAMAATVGKITQHLKDISVLLGELVKSETSDD